MPRSASRSAIAYWQPHNYDGKVHGTVPLYKALAKSYNLATVNVGLSIGVKRIAELLQQLGVTRKIQVVPSLLLGATALSPLEVAQVYQTIAAGGFRAPLRAIREVVDAQGRPLNRYPLAVEQVAPASSVFLTTWAMQQVVKQGTATALHEDPAGGDDGGGQDRHHRRTARQLVRRLQRRQGGRGLGRARRQQAGGLSRRCRGPAGVG